MALETIQFEPVKGKAEYTGHTNIVGGSVRLAFDTINMKRMPSDGIAFVVDAKAGTITLLDDVPPELATHLIFRFEHTDEDVAVATDRIVQARREKALATIRGAATRDPVYLAMLDLVSPLDADQVRGSASPAGGGRP